MKVGDIVLVHEVSPLKKKYFLAKVNEVMVSRDGFVCSYTVGHSIYPKRNKAVSIQGRKWIQIKRSV